MCVLCKKPPEYKTYKLIKKSTMAERPGDLNLPTPVVSKLINDCLPSTCKVSDEAKVAITKV